MMLMAVVIATTIFDMNIAKPIYGSWVQRLQLITLLAVVLLGHGGLAQAQSSEVGQTIAQWNASNSTCRNASAPALEAVGACEQRDTLSKVLALMNYCHDPSDKAEAAKWTACDAANKALESDLARTTAGFQRMGGVFVLPAMINEKTTTYFIVDSGAANVQIPEQVADELMGNGTLSQSDFLSERRFVLANGQGVMQRIIRLRSVKIGNRSMENVLAAIGARNSQALIGQSLLRRLNWWKIDNVKNAIELEFTGSF